MTVLGTWLLLKRSNASTNRKIDYQLKPISILKPLKGSDPDLEDNLSSFFNLDYPKYEIIFSVADKNDPARYVAQAVMDRYPSVPAKIIVTSQEVGTNPKVNNLVLPYIEAKYDLVLISDSNIRVGLDYLKEAVSCLTPKTGVVTALVSGHASSGLGGHLEALHLNTFCTRWMLLAERFGYAFVVGKSMLFRRSTAKRFGGIGTLAHYIAEDFMTGFAMKQLGLSVKIMEKPVEQYIGSYSFRQFWSRHIRWGRIRKAQTPIPFYLEPFTGALLVGLMGAFSFQNWCKGSLFMFLGIHLFLWLSCDLIMVSSMQKKVGVKFVCAWIVRECIAFPLWLHVSIGNTVNWRGNRLKILLGGLLTNDCTSKIQTQSELKFDK